MFNRLFYRKTKSLTSVSIYESKNMDRNIEFTTQNDLENSGVTQNYQNRTSFLIEDILYRQKNDTPGHVERTYENCAPPLYREAQKAENDKIYHQQPKTIEKPRVEKPTYGYFQPGIIQNGLNCVQNFQGGDNGYIQVMGALGAYLQTPYKNMTDPYFLTQGKFDQNIIYKNQVDNDNLFWRYTLPARPLRHFLHGNILERTQALQATESQDRI